METVHEEALAAAGTRSDGTIDINAALRSLLEGLLNAEKLEIILASTSSVGSIGGSSISVYRPDMGRRSPRLPLLSSLGRGDGRLLVEDCIEGDTIAIENVTARRVSGRVVAVGEGCKIDLLQYSEQVELHPDAQVGRCEQV